MDYQIQKAIVIILLAVAVVVFHLSISAFIWAHRYRLTAILWLVVLSEITYALCWIMALVIPIMNGFPRQPDGRIEIETARWTFNLILNPCGRFPWFDEHLGHFLCGIAVLLFGPSVFFMIGLLPQVFMRRSSASLPPPQ